MTAPTTPRIVDELRPLAVPIDSLTPYPGNAKRHDLDVIRQSLRDHGQYRPAVVHASSGYVLVGNGMLAAAKLEGMTELARVVKDCSDEEARRLVLLDNRSTELGGYDEQALADLLTSLPTIEGTGYDDDTLASILASVYDGAHSDARDAEVAEGRRRMPKKRVSPLDLIFSINAGGSHAEGMVGFRLGWQSGVMSTHAASARNFFNRYPRAPRLGFMDNEWHGYDHAEHLTAVAEFKPKYATTRDLMTKEQCVEADVEWYSLSETLDMAEQIANHCDNVIMIPKYDCLAKLPRTIGKARVVLGYSVESSYGGTPLPVESFRGWPIHLLGGPWDKQRAYLNLMGDDVVSLDNNHLMRIAQFGQVCMMDGSTSSLDDLLGYHLERSFMVAMSLSLGNIATAVMQQYGVPLEPVAIDPEQAETGAA